MTRLQISQITGPEWMRSIIAITCAVVKIMTAFSSALHYEAEG